MVEKYAILTRAIIEYDSRGKRLKNPRLGKWVVWDEEDTSLDNFRHAVAMVIRKVERGHAAVGGKGKVVHTGYIVYRKKLSTGDVAPLFTAKWGHGIQANLYTQFKSPEGLVWRRKAGI